jgi:DNA-binding FadR family transcriptional regulator
MSDIDLDSDLLTFLVQQYQPGDRLPTISELQAKHLGLSVSKLREQLEVARALGFVEVRSKTGMKMRAYSFAPAVRLSLRYALALDWHHFEQFSALRNQVEVAFWDVACATLTADDFHIMRECVDAARRKLEGEHIRIPNDEHRTFHLTVFSHLDNPFVTGILEAYWDAYKAVEVHRYHDYDDLIQVWEYHARILTALEAGDIAGAKALFIAHTQLIRFQPEHRNGRGSADND